MIELVNYDVVLNKNTYAEFTLYILKFDLEIAGCREFRKDTEKGKQRWFSFPVKWVEKGDYSGYKPLIRFRNKLTEEKIWEKARELIDAHLIAHPELDVKGADLSASESELPF